jgi:DNA-directed RNA polymerase subunit L
MFNVVSTCAYGNTVDPKLQARQLQLEQTKWREEGKSEEEVVFESQNWTLLDGLRLFKPDSFDFVIQTIGVYSNEQIVQKACGILTEKLSALNNLIDGHVAGKRLQVERFENTIPNCFNVILENEDYTIGKVLEYFCHVKFFAQDPRTMIFCGFVKMHPHDADSILRVAFAAEQTVEGVPFFIQECINDSIVVFDKISDHFGERKRHSKQK